MISLGDLNSLQAASSYGQQDTNWFETGGHILGAAAVDIGVTIWNSLIPEATGYETSTAKVLQDMGADGALTTYQNNTDLVNTLSFIGGVFIPGGAALKLSRGVRAGLKGTSYLSPTRHKADLLKFEKLIEDAGQKTLEYNQLRRSMFMRGQAENIMDTVAMELAVVGTFNAHPFMEDYMKDPISNFALSLAIGGGIGSGLSAIASRTAIRGVEGAVESAALGTVSNAAALFDMPFSDTAGAMANLNLATKRLDFIAEMPQGTPGYNNLVREQAKAMAGSIRGRMTDLATAKTSKEMRDMLAGDKELAETVLGRLADLRFGGTDKISFFKLGQSGLKPTETIDSTRLPTFRTTSLDEAGESIEQFHSTSYYNADLDAFVTKSQAEQLANAADLGYTPAQISRMGRKLGIKRLQNKFAEDLMGGRTADVEASWLQNMDYYSKQPTKNLLQAEFVDGDLPAMNGWLSAVEDRKTLLQAKLADDSLDAKASLAAAEELSLLKQAKVKVYDENRLKLVDLEEMPDGLPTTFTNANDYVKPTHIEDITQAIDSGEIQPLLHQKVEFGVAEALSDEFSYAMSKHFGKSADKVSPSQAEKFAAQWIKENKVGQVLLDEVSDTLGTRVTDLQSALKGMIGEGVDLSAETALLLLRWIGGKHHDKEAIRNAVASARTLRNGKDSITPYHNQITELLNNPATLRQKEALGKHADAKGNVYIYRGLPEPPKGGVPLESYSFTKNIAKRFEANSPTGSSDLYKIHMDDMLGYLYAGEREWLVGTSTRKGHATVEDALAAEQVAGKTAKQPRVAKTMDVDTMSRHFVAAKGQAVHDAVKEGSLSAEVIAARFNTQVDHVVMAGDNPNIYNQLASIQDEVSPMSIANRWASASQIPEAVSPARRTMRLDAREDQTLGRQGELLRAQRDAILDKSNLDNQMRGALNRQDSLSAARIQAKVNNLDDMQAELNDQWIRAAVDSSSSVLAREVMDGVLDAGNYKVLRESLSQFVNSKGGNTLTNSADFVTRLMGEVGPMITANGDHVTDIANKATKRLLDPLATQFRKLHKDDAARTEYAILDNIRQTTGGAMEYDAELRKLVTHTRDPKTGDILSTVEHSNEVVSEAVHGAMIAAQNAGQELHEMQKVINKMGGREAPASIGLWMPSTSLKNKEYAYVNNLDDRTQKLLVGDTAKELEETISAYKAGPNERIVRRSEASMEQRNAFHPDLERVTLADINLQKKGIGQAIPDLSPQRLDDIVEGYRNRIVAQTSNMTELGSYDLMQKLSYVSELNRKHLGNPPSGWRRLTQSLTTQDTAADVKDLFLGKNPVYRNEFMGSVNETTDAIIQGAIMGMNKAWEAARPLVGSGDKRRKMDYDKYTALREAAGIPNVFEAFDEPLRPLMLERARTMGVANPNRVIQIGNEIATTLALKLGEIAQPIVNMLSLPILMTSTISRGVKAANMNNPDDLLQAGSLSVMMGGFRRAASTPLADRGVMRMAEAEELFNPIMSEVDAVMKLSKFAAGGPAASLEKLMDNTFVNIMSAPAVWTEGLTRKIAFTTGVEQARRLYGPGATDAQVLIFARDFMKQSIGNYSSSQRPMLFQGSAGAAMGLFQTYMLTFAQNTYRHLEVKDYKGLGKMMLAQGGIFGAGSLPGFQPISEAIANNFSDDNFDLTTGTYRALPDSLASLLIYGLPSNLGPALHTRGDIAPRVPTGFTNMVAPSMVGQVLESMFNVGKAITQTDVGAGQAFFEALSTQSVSRPIARLSELASGHAITGAGGQILGPEEVWTWQGVTSRLMSTRGLREAKLRESIHLNSAYGAVDRENRQAVIQRLRTAIRNDTLTNDMMDRAAVEYLRTGSPQGWQSALNQAFMDNTQEISTKFRDKFKDSPLGLVVDDLY